VSVQHYLDPAIICELHAVVGNELVDLAVLVAFALGVADQDDHLRGFGLVEFMPILVYERTNAWFAHDGGWYVRSRGLLLDVIKRRV
jgi:hypothetical protein